jgi:hypothetical protein
VKIPVLEQIRESAVQLSYCHIYHIISPDPCPCHHSFAVPSGKKKLRKKTREMSQFVKKSAKV